MKKSVENSEKSIEYSLEKENYSLKRKMRLFHIFYLALIMGVLILCNHCYEKREKEHKANIRSHVEYEGQLKSKINKLENKE
jgi:hypothetical protein